MTRTLGLLLLAVSLATLAALWFLTRERPPYADEPTPVVTPSGETLPPFARARLGAAPSPLLWGALRVTPDGRRAVVGRGEWDVATIDLATRQIVSTVPVEPWRPGRRRITRTSAIGMRIELESEEEASLVRAMNLSADGARVGCVVGLGVRVFGTTDGTKSRRLEFQAIQYREIVSAALAPDGWSVVAVAERTSGPRPGTSTTAALWMDFAAGRMPVPIGTPGARGAAFAPDGAAVALVSDRVEVVHLPSRASRFRTEPEGRMSHHAVSWSPDGTRLAHPTGEDSVVVIRDAATGREVARTAPLGQFHMTPHVLSWSPDGRHVAAAGVRTAVIDASTGAIVARLPSSNRLAAFTPDGTRLVVADGVLRMFDTVSWAEIDAPPVTVRPAAAALAWAPDGSWIVTADRSGNVRSWNARDGALRRDARPNEVAAKDVTVSPDGSRLAVLSVDGTVSVLDAETLVPVATHAGPKDTSVAWRGTTLVRLDGDEAGAWTEIDVATGTRTSRFTLPAKRGQARLVPGGALAVVRAWAPNTAARARIVDLAAGIDLPFPATASFNEICFAPDGSASAAFEFGGAGRRGGSFGGFCVRTLPACADVFAVEVSSNSSENPCAVTPGADLVAWSAWNSSVDLWHVPTGARLRTFDGTRSMVRRLEFSPDGHTLAAASDDGTVLLWDVSPWRRAR